MGNKKIQIKKKYLCIISSPALGEKSLHRLESKPRPVRWGMSARYRICQGDAPPPCLDKDLSVTCNVAPSVSVDSPLPPGLWSSELRGIGRLSEAPVSATRRGYRSLLFVRRAFSSPDFYLAVEPLLCCLSCCCWGRSVSHLRVLSQGNINIRPLDETETWKQGFETGVRYICSVGFLKVKCAMFGNFEKETATSSVYTLYFRILYFPFPFEPACELQCPNL